MNGKQLKRCFSAVVCLMLSACTTSNTLKPVLGDESYTPMGWVQYCSDNPKEC